MSYGFTENVVFQFLHPENKKKLLTSKEAQFMAENLKTQNWSF